MLKFGMTSIFPPVASALEKLMRVEELDFDNFWGGGLACDLKRGVQLARMARRQLEERSHQARHAGHQPGLA